MGFRKILKKHDKNFQSGKGLEYYHNKVERAPIFTNNKLEQIVNSVENTYTYELEKVGRLKLLIRTTEQSAGIKKCSSAEKKKAYT